MPCTQCANARARDDKPWTLRRGGNVNTRIQLSLYVPEPMATTLGALRQTLDPIQSSLIPAHVTLCREGELEAVSADDCRARLALFPAGCIALQFGWPEPFSEHGILLPCIAGEDPFIQLRQHILGKSDLRRQAPHITLAHPRNPKASGNSLARARVLPREISIAFSEVRWIEQHGNDPWRVLDVMPIGLGQPCR
jgi:hypothetical protein